MSVVQVRVRKNLQTYKTEIFIFREIDIHSIETKTKDGWTPQDNAIEMRPFISLPFNSDIIVADQPYESQSMLKQKDDDKNQHINNLNDIIKTLVSYE